MRYDQQWHSDLSDMTSRSAEKILSYLLSRFPIRSVIEFGCGHAHWLEVAQKSAINDIYGLDGHWTERDKLRISPDLFCEVDLETSVDLNRKFDLTICMEVGEHLQEASAQVLIRSIVRHTDLVLFGAAIPLQGGFKHINEKWPSFWADHFDALGYQAFDLIRPTFWMDQDIHYYYRQNALVYINRNAHDLILKAETLSMKLRSNPIIDVVHPEKYMDYASYESIDLRRIVRKLPKAVWAAINRRLPF